MNTVLKYPGSKWSTVSWIIEHFPEGYEKLTYCEPFFGSGAAFFNKKRSVIETINDLDGNVVNLFKVIRERPEELAMMIECTPWSREEYRNSYLESTDELEAARRFLVRMWQAIGAKSSDSTGWRNWIKDGCGWNASWVNKLPGQIMEVAQRLRHNDGCIVQIENKDAITLIERYEKPNVFIYADPPYLLSTRSKRIYKYEMTNQDHERLLQVLLKHPGPVMISGYDSDLYNATLSRWNREERPAKAEGGRDSTEVIWFNYEPPAKQLEIKIV